MKFRTIFHPRNLQLFIKNCHDFKARSIILILVFYTLLFSLKITAQYPSIISSNVNYQLHIQKATEKIEIDGKLREDSRQVAEIAGDIWISYPVDGCKVPPDTRTEVRMTYDDHHLYLSAICDSPSNKWFVAVESSTNRWIVEMAIPFKTRRFDPTKTSWGINIPRGELRTNTWQIWAPVPCQLLTVDLGYTGSLLWGELQGKVKGNISLIPYTLRSYNKDFEEGSPVDWDFKNDVYNRVDGMEFNYFSLNAKWQGFGGYGLSFSDGFKGDNYFYNPKEDMLANIFQHLPI